MPKFQLVLSEPMLSNMSLDELVHYADRSDPVVAALCEKIEALDLENSCQQCCDHQDDCKFYE